MANKRIRKKLNKKKELREKNRLAKGYYCIDCLSPLEENQEVCVCGSKSYFSGRGLKIEAGQCFCQCGSQGFKHHLTQELGVATSHVFACGTCGEYLVQTLFD